MKLQYAHHVVDGHTVQVTRTDARTLQQLQPLAWKSREARLGVEVHVHGVAHIEWARHHHITTASSATTLPTAITPTIHAAVAAIIGVCIGHLAPLLLV